jgi:hypothetical protein
MPTKAKGPFRADHVGSLLRPAKLQQARMQRLRKNFAATIGTSISLPRSALWCSKKGTIR